MRVSYIWIVIEQKNTDDYAPRGITKTLFH